MTSSLLLFQLLNGLQYGVMLSLLAAGLTLVFGIMNFINLSHGALYMMGAFVGATTYNVSGSFLFAIAAAVAATAAIGMLIERLVLWRLYSRDHLDQVLVTYGFILIFNEIARTVWGVAPYYMAVPEFFSGPIRFLGIVYPSYRLVIVSVGVAFAIALYLLIHKTRFGMLVRAGSQDAEIVGALGVNVRKLNSVIFALGAGLAGLAGVLAGPIVSVEPGMGENILILTFVVIVVGGIGSVRGAFLAAMIVGLLDTLGRAFALPLLTMFASAQVAAAAGPALASITIYIVMALVLAVRPEGLFPVKGR